VKRLFLFLLLAGAGVALLLNFAGGLEGPHSGRPKPVVTEHVAAPTSGPVIQVPDAGITDIVGITQPAPPHAIRWHDRLSDEHIDIPTFTPWRFRADDAQPLPTMDEEKQGVLCHNVTFLLYREPRTRAEALALARNEDGAYDALLHQSFRAREARVFGRLGDALAQRRAGDGNERALEDTQLRLSHDVVIVDRGQGLEIRGEDVRVWPEQGRATGTGPFTLRHEAFVLKGQGLEMERDKAKGWGRITILRQPALRITSAGHGKNGKPLFNFGPGDFKPANISSEGRAVFVRQESRRETALTITFLGGVQALQAGGRTLEAGRAELLASREGPAALRRKKRWELRHFYAEKGVALAYPGHTSKGAAYLTSVRARRLVHEVPAEGPASTVLEGDVRILLRGEIPILGPDGRLSLSCRDRAWIGPLPAGAPTGGLDATILQQISLRGLASIEREQVGPGGGQDVLEADAIDLVVMPKSRGDQTSPMEVESRMTAIHFAALGNVRIGGTRLRGAMQRLVADDLHTSRPHITAEGEGTRFEFAQIGSRQRLLGPSASTDTPTNAAADAPSHKRSGRWALQRLVARGRVDIDTSLGGPAIGIPAHLTGDEVSYDRISRRARLVATGPTPAGIAWSASRTQTNTVESREMMLDRTAGRITAKGTVHATLFAARHGGRTGLMPQAARPSRERLRGGTLSVRTDARIDLHLVRTGSSATPELGQEQTIHIAGPVTAELRAADGSRDRMRSESLDLALIYLERKPTTPGATAPNARMGTRRTASTPTRTPNVGAAVLQRYEVRAGSLRVDMKKGAVALVEARDNVDLEGHEGHVRGDRVTYDDAAERIEVEGSAAHPAVALLGQTDQRSEVTARRLILQLTRGATTRLEAHAPDGRTSNVQLYRDVANKPGQVEWFTVTYEGRVVITNEALRAGRVLVMRRVRGPNRQTWSAPSILRAPSLRVDGSGLLSTTEHTRKVRRIVAEGRPEGGRMNEAHFQSGAGKGKVQVWGYRFDFDVAKSRAELTGTPQRDVTMLKGDGIRSSYTKVTIDMNTNLPVYLAGSRILWRPRAGR